MAVYILSTNSGLLELAKLPVLVEHFREHKQWDPVISFIGFMHMHYLQDENKYGDQAKDMEMPFKTPPHSFGTILVFIMPSPDFMFISKGVFKEREQKLITDSSAYSSQYLSSIWQPPRSC